MNELQYQVDLLSAMNRKLEDECSIYRLMLDSSSDAYLYYDFAEGRYSTMGDWKGFFEIEIRDRNDVARLFSQVREEDIEAFRNLVYLEKTGKRTELLEFCKKGGKQWIECKGTVIFDEAGGPSKKLLKFRDITKFKKQNDYLSYLAYYDSLTGLLNRNSFMKKLIEWIERAGREGTMVSLAFVDINDFRKINDGIGMLVGDELLQRFGKFLQSLCEGDSMMCAHLNADVFCLAIYDPVGDRAMRSIYQRILERLTKPFELMSGPVFITLSVGVAEYPEAASTAFELLERAEIVMFRAKHTKQNGIRYFDAPIIQSFLHNAALEQKLKSAALDREFMLYYQPQYAAQGGRMRGVEALIRWRDSEGQMISPGEFIPIAEKSSIIVNIGVWVAQKAVSTLAEWKRKYGVNLTMSINVSAVHFSQDGFAHWIIDLIKSYGLPLDEVELEITETVLIDDFLHILKKLELLQQYGIKLAIDDFGTGYASLAYLKNLPVDTIKIDKTFIDSMLVDKEGDIIVEGILDMVNRLGYDSVAEGVETQEQLDHLRNIGCKYIQGYLLGRPVPQEQLEELLEGRIWE